MMVQEKVRMAWASLSRGERKGIRMKARTSPEAVVRSPGKIVLGLVQRVRPATIA